MTIDPVCGMNIDENSAPAHSEYDGKTYYFCSTNCREAFEDDPEQYIESAA